MAVRAESAGQKFHLLCGLPTKRVCFFMMGMHNFNSGPAVLPQQVLQEAAEAIHQLPGTYLSILEIGHRSAPYMAIHQEARERVKKLMQLSADHEVLLLHGGATTQFMQVPYNLLPAGGQAAYCNNGIWGAKAIKEALLWGNAQVVNDSSPQQHRCIDFAVQPSPHAAYLHYTTNNTVEGTQWPAPPDTELPLVADMSSDIFSRPYPFARHALMYAGAQKNLGAAGVTLVVVNKNSLGHTGRALSPILDYQKHIEAHGLLHTPPVFAVYVLLLTLRWIEASGGLHEMEKQSIAKSALLYHAIDRLPLFEARVQGPSRSRMNVTFTLPTPALETAFLQRCSQENMVGVKGYRTVGGLRVSLYNALPMHSVETLVSLMEDFISTTATTA